MKPDKRARLLRRYGITLQQYNKLLLIQYETCAICRRPPKTRRLHVDHDHATGRIRGLLCMTCNRYRVSKNTLESARAVVRYLSNEAFDARNL